MLSWLLYASGHCCVERWTITSVTAGCLQGYLHVRFSSYSTNPLTTMLHCNHLPGDQASIHQTQCFEFGPKGFCLIRLENLLLLCPNPNPNPEYFCIYAFYCLPHNLFCKFGHFIPFKCTVVCKPCHSEYFFVCKKKKKKSTSTCKYERFMRTLYCMYCILTALPPVWRMTGSFGGMALSLCCLSLGSRPAL